MQASEIKPGERVKDVAFTEDTLAVDLADGHTIVVPLVWYPRLLDASSEQRLNWQVSAGLWHPLAGYRRRFERGWSPVRRFGRYTLADARIAIAGWRTPELPASRPT
jgi:hypothetical protein